MPVTRGYSSAGRATRSQRVGQGFESPYLHPKMPINTASFSFVLHFVLYHLFHSATSLTAVLNAHADNGHGIHPEDLPPIDKFTSPQYNRQYAPSDAYWALQTDEKAGKADILRLAEGHIHQRQNCGLLSAQTQKSWISGGLYPRRISVHWETTLLGESRYADQSVFYERGYQRSHWLYAQSRGVQGRSSCICGDF